MRHCNKAFTNIIAALFFATILCLSSCTGNDNTTVPQTNQGQTQANQTYDITSDADSLNATQDSSEPAKPSKPELTFASTQEAIDYMNSSANADKYAEGILHQMAEDEVAYVAKLLSSEYNKFLIIDKQIMRVGLFDKYGREILSYGIACSRRYGTKHKKADNRTPEGFFSVEGIYDSTNWLYTDDNGRTSKRKGQFGPRFIRIKNPVSYQIGLHGTCSPGSIGSRSSHGCIRVTNDNILELVNYVTPGMPVIITPSERDQQVNEKEGYKVAMVTMDPYGKYKPSYTAYPLKHKSGKPKHKDGLKEDSAASNPEESTQLTENQEPATQPAQIPDSI